MSSQLFADFASAIRGEGLTVNFSGLPGGEFVSRGLDWVAGQVADYLDPGSDVIGGAYGRVTQDSRDAIQEAFGVDVPVVRGDPSFRPSRTFPAGFLVSAPTWEDVLVAPAFGLDDPVLRREKALDEAERLARSPTPPNIRRMGEILTTLDNLQDDAATLAVALMLVEKVAGRAIPGVGQVALAADAFNLVQAFLAPVGAASIPGRRAKRQSVEKGRAGASGYAARVEDLRRTGNLKFGWGDLIQGLQSTANWAGVGIQLGGLVAALQDAAFGVLRGAEFRVSTRIPGILGIGQDLLAASYRSPRLSDVHVAAPDFISTVALRVFGGMARVAPWLDHLSESALAWSLVGERLAENALGPWLRKGTWIDPLTVVLDRGFPVVGTGDFDGGPDLRSQFVISAWAPATTAALLRAVSNVPDRRRQALYGQMVSSIGYGLLADVEPEAVVVEHGPIGPLRDAFLVLDAGLRPRFDLGE